MPEVDPAALEPGGRIPVQGSGTQGDAAIITTARGNLIFCGMCGALNPSSNHYCAACGTTLVDAFHASEGLRVFELPDAASRLIEIVPSGSELDLVDDPNAPADYARIRLSNGKLGYIRLPELASLTSLAAPIQEADSGNINTAARGCVSPVAALASVVLLVMLGSLSLYLLSQEDSTESGFLALVMCAVVSPIAFLMIVLYLMARDREDRRLDTFQTDDESIE